MFCTLEHISENLRSDLCLCLRLHHECHVTLALKYFEWALSSPHYTSIAFSKLGSVNPQALPLGLSGSL